MSWAEQGAYSRLLNKQADKGHLSLEAVKKVLKRDFDKLWPGIAEKFLIDDHGNYYNERMDIEVGKRRKNSQTQANRINKYWEEQRNNGGNTTEYSTDIPIANADANSGELKKEPPIRHVGLMPEMVAVFKSFFPKYPSDIGKDYAACLAIAHKLADSHGWTSHDTTGAKAPDVLREWTKILGFSSTDKWFKTRSISDLNNEWQRLMQSYGSAPTAAKQESAPVRSVIETRTNAILDQYDKR